MKNIPTRILRISLIILSIAIMLTAAKAFSAEDHSQLAGKTCLLQSGTEIIINLKGNFVQVFVGNTYAVKVLKVAELKERNLWYAMIKFSDATVNLITPRSKITKSLQIPMAGVLIGYLEGCK